MLLTLTVVAAVSSGPLALPGGPPVGMDFIVYDAANHRVWIPAGNTGNVDVLDTVTGKITTIGGFATKPSPRPNRPPMGPSSATVGDGVVWVGNRGDDSVCAIDARTLQKKSCAKLPTMPDGLQYVAATHEVWVTTPQTKSITIVNANDPTLALGKIVFEGEPEGFALDGGVFYTNLEDQDRTLSIDVKTHKVLTNVAAGCGKAGPRGIEVDGARHLLMVACTDGAVSFDLNTNKAVGRLHTGAGVDNLAYARDKKWLYAASASDGTLTVAAVSDAGAFTMVAALPTPKGARNPVIDSDGNAYVEDSMGGRLIFVKAPAR